MPLVFKNRAYKLFHITGPLFAVLFFCCCSFIAHGQKYIFSHYNIEDGLIQSQVNKLTQDRSHYLWMGTLGGVCRYDGKDFACFSKENGLPNNFTYTVFCDKDDRKWFGTQMGLACFNGKAITSYPIPANVRRTWVTNIAQNSAGDIWLTMDSKLFKVAGSKLQQVPVADTDGGSVINIAVNPAGILYVAVYQDGVYCLKSNKWTKEAAFEGENQNITVRRMVFDKAEPDKLYFISNNKLLQIRDHAVSPYPNVELNKANISFLSLAQDAQGNLWMGSSSGVYYLKGQKLIHFNSLNGFTDVSVPEVYCDKDRNIWLGTWGEGIYKYEGDAYTLFDQAQGLSSFQTIMGIARDKQHNIYLGSEGNGLIKYDGKNFKTIDLPTLNTYAKKIQSVYTDRDSNIWIGTSTGGLWKYDGRSYTMAKGSEHKITNSVAQDANGTMWVASPLGVYYYSGDSLRHIIGIQGFTSSLLPLKGDSMLIGTQAGVRLIVNKQLVPGFKLGQLESSNTFCMISYKNLVLFGTADRGLFVWNRNTGSIRNYNVTNGFNSNSIYNLVADKGNVVWAGTGRGLNKIVFDEVNANCTIFGGGSSKAMIAEANQNSVLYLDGRIWMGTTKGLIVYNTKADNARPSSPYVVIQSVRLFRQQKNKASDNVSDDNWPLKDGDKISFDQSHLAISFLGVYLKDPGSISYQYQLIGIDDKFCQPTKNTTVDYTSLPPGNYTFQVKATNADGVQSSNMGTFSFEIMPLFYQTWYFKVLLLLSFALLGIIIQTWLHKRKLHAVKAIERMKREEKQKIRQQTAEDFHDDLGNKLTRITVLSDMLTATIDDKKHDQKKIVGQIKQNAEELYNGTKDILWALDPQSDNLYEILLHIKQFGTELFQDTAIEFDCNEVEQGLKAVKLPMEYSRNMTMIYKELLNNILKHASATKVRLNWNRVNKEFSIVLADNGKGFNMQTTVAGHGTNNVKSRVTRIGGDIEINAVEGAGVGVVLKLKLKHL